MSLRVIGAGLPRTGTSSLKLMLEELLDGPCFHMRELRSRADVDGPAWLAAFGGDADRLDGLFAGWVAAVDWPAAVFWRELADRHPDALVVLSHRGSSETWWASADATVWEVQRQIKHHGAPEPIDGIHQLMREKAGFSEDLAEAAARDRYDTHFAEVVDAIDPDRLLIWQPSDGWEPLCERLGVAVPEEAPAHANTSSEFQARFAMREHRD